MSPALRFWPSFAAAPLCFSSASALSVSRAELARVARKSSFFSSLEAGGAAQSSSGPNFPDAALQRDGPRDVRLLLLRILERGLAVV